MVGRIKIEGLRELDRALGQLSKSTGKNVLRRVARKALTPFAEDMREKVPEDKGDLKRGVGVGTRLTRRQAALHRKTVRDSKASIEMFAGAGGHPQAVQQEFGNVNHPPQPSARPAWDANKDRALRIVVTELGREIEKAAQRAARKRTRQAAR